MVLEIGVGGRILTAAGDNRIRWKAGERLADLFEARCDACGAQAAAAASQSTGRRDG